MSSEVELIDQTLQAALSNRMDDYFRAKLSYQRGHLSGSDLLQYENAVTAMKQAIRIWEHHKLERAKKASSHEP